MRIAFISNEGLVRNVIVATNVDERTKTLFLDQARAVSDAKVAIEITDDATPVWIGGSYTPEEGFLPPPPPPEPEIVEGTSEELAPLIEEIISVIEEPTI